MKLRAMTFVGDDEDVLPDTITVTMSIAEAAAIAMIFGKLNSYAIARLTPQSPITGDIDGIYCCLVGDVFNRYWDNSVDDVLPGAFDLANLNEPPGSER